MDPFGILSVGFGFWDQVFKRGPKALNLKSHQSPHELDPFEFAKKQQEVEDNYMVLEIHEDYVTSKAPVLPRLAD